MPELDAMKNSGFTPTPKFGVSLQSKRGFTLVEIVVVMGLFAVLAGFGLFLSIDFYRSYAFRAERDMLISVLQKARSQALNNIRESPHGVRVEEDSYILFQGGSYDPTDPANQAIAAAPSISHTGLSEVVFTQLSGGANASGTIDITDGLRTVSISINNAGRISW